MCDRRRFGTGRSEKKVLTRIIARAGRTDEQKTKLCGQITQQIQTECGTPSFIKCREENHHVQ